MDKELRGYIRTIIQQSSAEKVKAMHTNNPKAMEQEIYEATKDGTSVLEAVNQIEMSFS